MRLFRIERTVGTAAVVANGVEFDDGVVVVRRLAPLEATTIFPRGVQTLDAVLAANERIVWVTTLAKHAGVVERIVGGEGAPGGVTT